jgi:predicted metal-dependent enzyme (double-stranded beta helix superfamily)
MSVEDMYPVLKNFINDIEVIVQIGGEEAVVTKKVAERMKELLLVDGVIPDVYKQPNPNKYTLYPVYIAPDNSFSIASAVWDVGQSTPIHDHGTWGVIGIVQGKEHEIHYTLPSGAPPVRIMERDLEKGEVTVCCTSDQDVHEVSCTSKEPCVGIHVYGGNIGEIERHIYDPVTGNKKTVVTAWDPIPFNPSSN